MEKLYKVDGKMHSNTNFLKRVIVLLSTYNGEKYLKEQLDSIFMQEEIEVYVLIRDDGSTDGTRKILEQYSKKYSNMTCYFEENIGVISSFNKLIRNPIVDKFELIAFCDQDDVWLPLKLSKAIEKIELFDNKPQLYCGNLKVVDSNLNFKKMYHEKKIKMNFRIAVVQNCATGCTQVFNHHAVELYRMGIGKHMEMHDYWMFLVCLCMGKVIWDENAYILYRQHSNNVVGAKQNGVLKAIGNIYTNSGKRHIMIEDFFRTYKTLLAPSACSIFHYVKDYKTSFKAKLILIIDPRYHGYRVLVTLNFKLRVLINKLY